MFEIADIGLYEMDDEGQMNVATRTVNCLSLCSGIGGLELGLSLVIPELRVVCHVEREASAAALLVARMADENMDETPIWDDLTTFDGAAWRGTVDIVTAGFPCQPWSVAGKQKGTDDERWIWSDIIKIIREVRPGLVFLENVPGILVHAGLGAVLREMAETGFNAEWGCFTAAEVGASHRRERVFILAKSSELRAWDFSGEVGREDRTQNVRQGNGATSTSRVDAASATMADSNSNRLETGTNVRLLREQTTNQRDSRYLASNGSPLIFPPSPNDLEGWSRVFTEMPSLEPAVCRMADGVPGRVDRLRALGNAVVPLEAAYAFATLASRIRQIDA